MGQANKDQHLLTVASFSGEAVLSGAAFSVWSLG